MNEETLYSVAFCAIGDYGPGLTVEGLRVLGQGFGGLGLCFTP